VLGTTFMLGALATIPALALNLLGQSLFIDLFGRTPRSHLLVLFFIVGPIEELLKLLVVYFYAYRRKEFDEPLDGVIFSATAALGFAAIENVVYLAQNEPMLVLLRGPLSNPGHALFSAMWGLSLSKAKAAPNLVSRRFPIVARGWILAFLLHSLFDILLAAAAWTKNIIFFVILIAVMVWLFFWVRSRIKFHSDTSPHREGTLYMPLRRYCQECGVKGTAGMRCAKCGAFIPEPEELELCSVCSTAQRPGAKFCSRCGANIKLPAKENLDTRPHFVSISSMGEERIAYILNATEVSVGRTLNNSFCILDEAQNATSEQMKMFLTRLGFDSKAVVTGDVTQVDLPQGARSGLMEAQALLAGIDGISFCYFTEVDVVRHPLVQEIIKAYDNKKKA